MSRILLSCLFVLFLAGSARAQCPAYVSAGGPTTFCAGGTVALGVSFYSTICTITAYQWQTKSSASVAWQNITGATNSTFAANNAGFYRAMLTVGSSSSFYADSVQVNVNPLPIMTLPSAVTICNGSTAVLCATGGSSSGFTYQWSMNGIPNAGSAACYTAVVAGTYACVVSSTSGCLATASTVVTVGTTPSAPSAGSNSPVCLGDTLRLTSGSVISGVLFSWTGPNGYTSNLQNPIIPNVSAARAGTYNATISAPGCTSLSPATGVNVVISCLDSVWAGDANADKIVDNLDALEIALTLGSSGYIRSLISTAWQPAFSKDWGSTLPGYPTVNTKHADCDGDGTVAYVDTLAVTANYGLTHPKEVHYSAQKVTGLPDLYFDLSGFNPAPNQLVNIPIALGTMATPMQNIAGIASRIMIDGVTPADTPKISYNGSWLGTAGNTLHFNKGLGHNRTDLAFARTDRRNTSGYGPLAWLSFTMPPSWQGGQQLRLYFDKEIIVDSAGNKLTQFNSVDDTLSLAAVGIAANALQHAGLSISPNPSAKNCVATINLSVTAPYHLELREMSGKLVWQSSGMGKAGLQNVTIPSGDLSAGMYFISLRCEGLSPLAPVRWVKE